jgi:MFS family permease
MNQTKLWTKDFSIVTAVNFFVALNYYLLMVVMAVYAIDTFGASPSEAGLAASIFVLGALGARFFSGRWIERVGRRRMLVIGTVLSLVMTVSYFGANGIWLLLIVRFIHGIAYGVASTATGTIVADIVPQNRQGEGIGYYMLSMTIATAIGPFLGMFLLQHGSFEVIFVACTISAIFSIANAFILTVHEIELTNEQVAEMKGFKWSNFFEWKALPISIVCAIIYFGYSSVLSFLTPYAREINLVDVASFFFVVFAVTILVSRPFTGRLFDSKGENATMYPAYLAFTVGMILLSQARNALILLLAGAFIGFGYGIVQSCGQAIAVKETPRHRFGLAISTFFTLADITVGAGPFALGFFIPLAGYSGVYMAMAMVAIACVFLHYLLRGRRSVLGGMGALTEAAED